MSWISSAFSWLAGKTLGFVPMKWLLGALGAGLLLGAGYLGLRWQLAEAEITSLTATVRLLQTERDLARTDQDALRRVAAALREQLEEAQTGFAAYVAESAADRQRLSMATEQPATPGKVVDDATSRWALERLDALFRR